MSEVNFDRRLSQCPYCHQNIVNSDWHDTCRVIALEEELQELRVKRYVSSQGLEHRICGLIQSAGEILSYAEGQLPGGKDRRRLKKEFLLSAPIGKKIMEEVRNSAIEDCAKTIEAQCIRDLDNLNASDFECPACKETATMVRTLLM